MKEKRLTGEQKAISSICAQVTDILKKRVDIPGVLISENLEYLADELYLQQMPFSILKADTAIQNIVSDTAIYLSAEEIHKEILEKVCLSHCILVIFPSQHEELSTISEVLYTYSYIRDVVFLSDVGIYRYTPVPSALTLVRQMEELIQESISYNDFEKLRKAYLSVKQRNSLLEPFYKNAAKEIGELKAAYTGVLQSTSWKLTSPIRLLLGQMRKKRSQRASEVFGLNPDGSVNYQAASALKLPYSPILAHHSTVDIIICIYNALDDVKKCIDSVLQCTSEPYHIILVDDNSMEPTRSYLEKLVAGNKENRFTLIQNDAPHANHGYTYASNIGLHASSADYCILLNSDTIVTPGWLDRMIACAESDSKIGVVGPLSNTASWQSIPEINGEDGDWAHNQLPKGYDVARMGQEIALHSGNIYPEVRLLNGFCLLLSRKTIQQVGYMDEENFGRGFGEEDDYNSRCYKGGIRLAVADDTFVFHAQSKSYSNERRMELSALSGKVLREKHGADYIAQSCAQIYEHFVMDSIRCRTKMMFERDELIEQGKNLFIGKKILFLLPASSAGGGGNVVIQEALAMQKMGVEVTLLNLYECKEGFEKSYPDINLQTKYVRSFYETQHAAEGYDVVCGTLYSTMKHCVFKNMSKAPRVAYYIQDYEPYFFEEEFSDEYIEAKNSYTLIPDCVNVTKTQWNRNTVRSQTGAECTVIGPSVNIDLFRPRKENSLPKKLAITAMIRPSSLRRAPEMTIKILRQIKLEFADYVDIGIFGCDPEKEEISQRFFDTNPLDFPCVNYGELSPEQTAALLAQTDIFADFSTFQAMGLTGMEAMASGCAVILPVYGGAATFARHRENSLVIDTLNEEVCYESLKELVVDYELRTQLSRQAYRDMCHYYPEKSAFCFLKALFPIVKKGEEDSKNA